MNLRGMHTGRWFAIGCFILAVATTVAAQETTPEETVKRYYTAVKAGDFKTAYQYVGKSMKIKALPDKPENRVLDQDEWAKDQQYVMQMTEAKIFDFHVYPGKLEGDQAKVPNLLSSQDKYLNQLGLEEHELFTLVREDGKWKIDHQQIVDPRDVAKWFPAEAAKPAK